MISNAVRRNVFVAFTNKCLQRRCISSKQPATLNIIGTGALGDPPSVSISTSKTTYLFNAGEGCSRRCLQQPSTIHNVSHIFVTQNKWNCIGGILGIFIHNYLIGSLQFHGPKCLPKILRRKFCSSKLSHSDFQKIEFNANNHYENDELRIDFISVEMPNDNTEIFAYICKLKRTEFHLIILDLPSKECLNKFINNESLNGFLENNSLDAVIHFTPQQINQTRQYQDFISKLKPNVNLYLDERNKSFGLQSAYEIQEQLNRINRNIFPIHGMDFQKSSNTCDSIQSVSSSSLLNSKYYLSKSHPSVNSDIDQSSISNAIEKQNIDLDRLKIYPKIILLGTGSGYTSPSRNATSILVHTTNRDCILLDCGEGTSSQIHMFYGKNARHIFTKIKAIFISHLHTDHFIGLSEIIRMRKQYLKSDREPLILLCPKQNLKSWLFFYDNNIDKIHNDLIFVDNENLMHGLSNKMCKIIGIESLKTCRVPHFDISYAVSLSIKGKENSFKLTFSGDTPLCDNFISLGRDSTLLIHEATYPIELQMTALRNRHSSVLQALEQSTQMNAKYTLLTHFGHRFGKQLPFIDTKCYPNVSVAFDFMEIVEDDLPILSSLYSEFVNIFGIYKHTFNKK